MVRVRGRVSICAACHPRSKILKDAPYPHPDSEKRLVKKCRELNAEIVANAAKVQTALKLNEEDQSTITALKKEIEKAWKMVDASHEKEAKAKETIQQLKVGVKGLQLLLKRLNEII
jgi:hypothetical protein